eukprot:3260780-Prorocentrum_lima.AAC.1
MQFRLNAFPDGTIELLRLPGKATFLARSLARGIRSAQLAVGMTITIYSRQMHIVDYFDEGTR